MTAKTGMVDSSNWQDRHILSVSDLTREARRVIETGFPLLWLEGEISNFSQPSSGHMYFSLKDEASQVRCAFFRGRNTRLDFRPANGMQVLAQVKVSFYEPRGEFQLIVENLEQAGHGALQRAFEKLKTRLQLEGLFDAAHKQPIPTLPKRIGIITSATGAAIRDVLHVLKRRFPAIPVLLYPVQVQGDAAAQDIAATLNLAAKRNEVDVILLVRGGGSLEDLWSFNEEMVARAIHACPIPIISGVGHETDTTIADFVADQRAPTPSAAAEMAVPDSQLMLKQCHQHGERLLNRMMRLWQTKAQRFDHSYARLTLLEQRLLNKDKQRLAYLYRRLKPLHPARRLALQAQHLVQLQARLKHSQRNRLRQQQEKLNHLVQRLAAHSPARQLIHHQQTLNQAEQQLPRLLEKRLSALLQHRDSLLQRLLQNQPGKLINNLQHQQQRLLHDLQALMNKTLQQKGAQLSEVSRALDNISPLKTIERGYAVVRDEQQAPVTSICNVNQGQIIHTVLQDGVLTSEVKMLTRQDVKLGFKP